jgi:hypothetical protein
MPSDTESPQIAPQTKEALGAALRHHLDEVSRLRQARCADPAPQDHLQLKAWQSNRLARTYPDLLADARHRPAAEFFLDELYGTNDFTARDAEVARIVPTLVAMLPARALFTLGEAVRMDAISESLDADMVARLRAVGKINQIDDQTYAAAYRACGRRDDRIVQLKLVEDIGATLDRLTRMPLLGVTLKMMRAPAEMAGLGSLHSFLQHGFQAFKHMHGADYFLATILERETHLMEQFFGDA